MFKKSVLLLIFYGVVADVSYENFGWKNYDEVVKLKNDAQELKNYRFNAPQLSTRSNPTCNFTLQNEIYICTLEIFNNDTSADFELIDGEHLNGFTNTNVTSIRASMQLTANIPPVICRQFPNLRQIYIVLSGVQVIDQNSFAGCPHLQNLLLYLNNITEIPSMTFSNNQNLMHVDLSENKIESFTNESFSGITMITLTLNGNRLKTFNGSWLSGSSNSLLMLSLYSNDITQLVPEAFMSFRNIVSIDIAGNLIQDMPLNVFDGLGNLQLLSMYQNRLGFLRPEWFRTLESLNQLRLEFNQISNLPIGVFEGNGRLQMLWMSYNNIKVIDSRSFGNLSNLLGFYFEFNEIFGIDEEFYDRAVNLNNLFLYGNNCTSTFFNNVHLSREQVRNVLRPCFDNFNPNFIRCDYFNSPTLGYTCRVTLQNPDNIEFDEILGSHLVDRDDSNVTTIEGNLQTTAIIPEVLCRQFENLREIRLTSSKISVLTQRAFAECRNLERLNLDFNDIRMIPANVFAHADRLSILSFYYNRIENIEAGAFNGSSLILLNLNNNQLSIFDSSWFDVQHEDTLWFLDLDSNNLTSLSSQTFSRFRGLEYLWLSFNRFTNIPADAFSGLESLVLLAMTDCQLTQLQHQWFDLSSLRQVYLDDNQLTDLPTGVFGTLSFIFLDNNQLTMIDSASFRNLNSLFHFGATNNIIDAIDVEFYDNANTLDSLELLNNICTSVNIRNFPANREIYRLQFEECFENFLVEQIGFIECEYEDMDVIGYSCIMTVHNTRGNDDFDAIEGDHVEGFTDADVTTVEAYRQHSTIVPSIICRQFPNLRRLYFGFSRVEDVTMRMFEDCHNLEYLNLESNEISFVPDFMIRTLETLVLNDNRIAEIESNSFNGTSLRILRLEGNQLTSFNTNWFNGINNTLELLTIRNNSFTELPENSFANLRNLRELEISFNSFNHLPDQLFQGLTNLQTLYLLSNNIFDLKTSWFNDLSALESLFISYNHIRSIPVGIFGNSPRLFELHANGNQLRVLEAASFGNLSSMLHITAVNNRIDLIDPEFFEAATNLYNLFLFNNTCTDENFLSIINDRDTVRSSLSACFENFSNDGTISCNYVESDFLPYICELSVQNARGINDFSSIDGQHVGSNVDGDVIRVEAYQQMTTVFPAVICGQFTNLREIYIAMSGIEELTRESFSDCMNLEYLNLEFNRIRTIPGDVLASSAMLNTLVLYSNEIREINESFFHPFNLTYLNLDVNSLTAFNPLWFDGSHGLSLEFLMLSQNSIQNLSNRGFENLSNLLELTMAGNPIVDIPNDAFMGLGRLRHLNINNCGIRQLQTQWFVDLSNLLRIYLNGNSLTEFPNGIFGNLTHVHVTGNQLRVLSGNSFRNLNSLVQLNAQNNQISAIDEEIFENAGNLYTLQLLNNICVSVNIVNLPVNRDYYRPQFEQCFGNF